MRALLIDDSGSMRAILRRYMQQLNYEVVEAANGEEGLKRFKEVPQIDLALVDWNMPVMDGLAFVRALRENKEYERVKVMMVTTVSDAVHMSQALEAGANEFVMKPFTLDILEQKITMLLDQN
jgi:two-component system chemotaxis response regulator CheY